MANEQLNLTPLLEAICSVLNAFNFPVGASTIEQAAKNRDNESNNIQLLANLKQELIQLPSLANININGEMRGVIQSLIESIKATNMIDKRFITRSINKFYNGFEPFARNEIQRSALIDMQIIKEEVLGIEPRHRVAHKLREQQDDSIVWKSEENNEELQMTRELKAADY